MEKFILGTKIGMTQIFNDAEEVVPVTLIEAGPIQVTQVMTELVHGYSAVQVGFAEKTKNIAKPQKGHLKGLKTYEYSREFRLDKETELKRGDMIEASIFEIGDQVSVTGISKGKGYQGSVKRHGFSGGPATHGHRHVLRQQGGTGGRFPQHTRKGVKMPGRMGSDQITQKGLKIAFIDTDNGIIGVNGSIPGRNGSLVKVVSR